MYHQSTSCGEVGSILHEIYEKIFGFKKNGVFIEVGANDGKTGSFTYNLARIGWKGIYFEPVPRIFNTCAMNHKNHPNIKVLNMGCGEKKDIVKITDGDTLSTMDDEMLALYKKLNWTRGNFIRTRCNEVEVEVDKLDNILEKENINNEFDLFILDVEGYEERVLHGFSLQKYKPKMVIIEIPDQFKDYTPHPNLMQKFARLRKVFEDSYTLLVNDVVDNVYIRNDLVTDENKNYLTYCSRKVNYPQYKK